MTSDTDLRAAGAQRGSAISSPRSEAELRRRHPSEDSTSLRAIRPRIAFEFEPHHCFACGELNEHGLHLGLHTDPNGSWTELTLDSRFQGWDEVAHGGIVCTILDEVMAWSVIGRGTWGVTARLNVAFRRPIPSGRAIRAKGWVVQEHRRASRTASEVLDATSGEILATAEGTFIAVPNDDLERLKARYGLRRRNSTRHAAPDTTGSGDAEEADSGRAAVPQTITTGR